MFCSSYLAESIINGRSVPLLGHSGLLLSATVLRYEYLFDIRIHQPLVHLSVQVYQIQPNLEAIAELYMFHLKVFQYHLS